MKVKTKLFTDLSYSQQRRLLDMMEAEAEKAVFDTQCDMQIVWLKMMCIALSRAGLSENEILIALGNWTNIYRQNSKVKTEAEQKAWLDGELSSIFANGFPEEIANYFKKL